jgi:hypothetical protein
LNTNSNKGVSTTLGYVKHQQRLIIVTPAASILGKRAQHNGLPLMISSAEEYVNFTTDWIFSVPGQTVYPIVS